MPPIGRPNIYGNPGINPYGIPNINPNTNFGNQSNIPLKNIAPGGNPLISNNFIKPPSSDNNNAGIYILLF